MFFPLANCLWITFFFSLSSLVHFCNKPSFCYLLGYHVQKAIQFSLHFNVFRLRFFSLRHSLYRFLFFLVADDEPKRDAKILKISEFIMLRNGNLFVFHFAACIHFGLCFFFFLSLSYIFLCLNLILRQRRSAFSEHCSACWNRDVFPLD